MVNLKSPVSPMKSAKGFTLVEVLVALVILAVALSAMIKTASENTVNTAKLRDKYFASLVATNKINEIRAARTLPKSGTSNGNVDMARQSWHWNIKVDKTPDESLRKLTVDISAEHDQDHIIYTLTSYLGEQ